MLGFGAIQDTYNITEPDPTGHSYANAITNALADAQRSVADIDLFIPHGLGIPTHDRAELHGLQKALGDDLKRIPLAPIGAQIGNLAAGCGVSAVAAVLALQSGAIPPSLNTKKTIDGIMLNVSSGTRQSKLKIAVSSVYSLGGQNAAIVMSAV